MIDDMTKMEIKAIDKFYKFDVTISVASDFILQKNGRYNPSIILAFKIARYFEMAIEDIFLYEEENDNEK